MRVKRALMLPSFAWLEGRRVKVAASRRARAGAAGEAASVAWLRGWRVTLERRVAQRPAVDTGSFAKE